MNKQEILITFFISCLNEEHTIIDTIKTIIESCKEVNISYEIVIIDDNSTDNTSKLINEFIIKNKEAKITLIRNSYTQGFSHNIIEGAFIGKGKYFKVNSAKNNETKESLISMLKLIGQAEIIIYYFRKDPRGIFRRVLSVLFNFIVCLISGHHIKYFNGSAIHLRDNILRWCPRYGGHGYHAEFLTFLLTKGASIIQIPVDSIEYPNRNSKAFTLKNLILITQSFLNIFFIRVIELISKKRLKNRVD